MELTFLNALKGNESGLLRIFKESNGLLLWKKETKWDWVRGKKNISWEKNEWMEELMTQLNNGDITQI